MGCAGDSAGTVGGGGFDQAGQAGAGEAGFRPVHAIGADASGEGGISGNKKHDPALAADAREIAADSEAISEAVMAPDDSEAIRKAADDAQDIGRAHGIGEMEGAGEGLSGGGARRLCEARGRKKLAADRGLGLRQGHGRFF